MKNKEKKKVFVQYLLIYNTDVTLGRRLSICENCGNIYSSISLDDEALGYLQTDIVTSILLT